MAINFFRSHRIVISFLEKFVFKLPCASLKWENVKKMLRDNCFLLKLVRDSVYFKG